MARVDERALRLNRRSKQRRLIAVFAAGLVVIVRIAGLSRCAAHRSWQLSWAGPW
jgi:hypothetical protein